MRKVYSLCLLLLLFSCAGNETLQQKEQELDARERVVEQKEKEAKEQAEKSNPSPKAKPSDVKQNRLGTVKDPDGYTNLRKENSSSSEILAKVNDGEEVEILTQKGAWYQVKTASGQKGYMHQSRVVLK